MRYVVVMALSVLALSACSGEQPSGELDRYGQSACDDLAGFLDEGAPESERELVLTEVVDNAKSSSVESIATAGGELEGMIKSDGWEAGTDAFTAACEAEGWQAG
ncbi:hypothetical protein LX16_1248 [Stackebrandtia albiflava]|uniref:Lipoprotein n=2 Tax=Stackebrandtia albiflava TaxID=406432 RepID=A0A562VCI3_9ACTN|nr:hypothetical protein LX16_1248 [Stackebrandtia albiflava]